MASRPSAGSTALHRARLIREDIRRDGLRRVARGAAVRAAQDWARRVLSIPGGYGLVRADDPATLSDMDRDLATYAGVGKSLLSEHERNLTMYTGAADAKTWRANARTAYEYHGSEVWLYVGIRILMDAAASVPGEWYVPDPSAENGRAPFKNATTERLTAEPNPHMDWADLIGSTIGYQCLSGMALWSTPTIADGRLLRSVWLVPPELLYSVGDAETLVTEWRYFEEYGGRHQPLDPESIAWFREWNPYTARLGLGRAQPAGSSLQEAAAIREWRTSRFEHDFRPSGWIETDKPLHRSVVARLREEFKIIHRPGSHEVGIFTHGAKYNESKPNGGGEYEQDREAAKREILAALGVPPFVAGDTESASHWNSHDQLAQFWAGTMAGIFRRLDAAISRQLGGRVGRPGARYRTRLETIPWADPERADREERWLSEYRDGALSLEEYRSLRGYGEVNPSHTFRQQGGAGMLFSADAPAKDDDDPEGSPGGGGAVPPVGGRDAQTIAPAPAAPPAAPAAGSPRAVAWTEERKATHHGAFVERQRLYVVDFAAELGKTWKAQGERMVALLDEAGALTHGAEAARAGKALVAKGADPREIERARVEIEKALTLDEFLQGMTTEDLDTLVAVVERQGLHIMKVEGQRTLVDALGQPAGEFSLADAILEDWMVHGAHTMGRGGTRGAYNTARERLLRSLSEGLIKGEGLRDLRLRVERVYEGMSTSHATMVARTETAAAQNRGIIEGYAFGGVEEKEWLTMRDGDVRADHQAMDGVAVGVRESFILPDGTAMQFPGDYQAPFAQSHNCRCTTIPVVRS